jgi:hypothetical protein
MVTFGGTLVIIPENGAVSPGLNIIPFHGLFYLTDWNLLTMEDTNRECRLHIGFPEDIDKMLGRACPGRGDHGNGHRTSHLPDQFMIKSAIGFIRVNTVEEDFSCLQ